MLVKNIQYTCYYLYDVINIDDDIKFEIADVNKNE